MKLVFRRAARTDFQNIYDYIRQDNPQDNQKVATAVVKHIRSSLNRLRQFPRSGRVGSVPGTDE